MNQEKGNTPRIEILANGTLASVAARNVAEIVAELGYADVKVATALNGEFVPERARASTSITSGDRIEILSARQGG